MANPITANGSISVDGSTLADGVEITLNMTYETLTAEMAFGESVAPKDLGPENVDGSFRFRYTQAEFDRLWDIYKAKGSVTIIAQPVTGSSQDTLTFSAKIASMPITFKAGQVIYISSNFVCSAGAGVTKAPNLTLNVQDLGSIAHNGDGGTLTDLVASGGTSTYTYAKTNGMMPPGLAMSSAGVWSGTLTAATPAGEGTYIWDVTVTDSASTPVTKAFRMTLIVT